MNFLNHMVTPKTHNKDLDAQPVLEIINNNIMEQSVIKYPQIDFKSINIFPMKSIETKTLTIVSKYNLKEFHNYQTHYPKPKKKKNTKTVHQLTKLQKKSSI